MQGPIEAPPGSEECDMDAVYFEDTDLHHHVHPANVSVRVARCRMKRKEFYGILSHSSHRYFSRRI